MRGSGRYCVPPFRKEKCADGDGKRQDKEGAVTKQCPNRQRIVVTEAAALDLNVQINARVMAPMKTRMNALVIEATHRRPTPKTSKAPRALPEWGRTRPQFQLPRAGAVRS